MVSEETQVTGSKAPLQAAEEGSGGGGWGVRAEGAGESAEGDGWSGTGGGGRGRRGGWGAEASGLVQSRQEQAVEAVKLRTSLLHWSNMLRNTCLLDTHKAADSHRSTHNNQQPTTHNPQPTTIGHSVFRST